MRKFSTIMVGYNLRTHHKLLIALCDDIVPQRTDCARFVEKAGVCLQLTLHDALHLTADYIL